MSIASGCWFPHFWGETKDASQRSPIPPLALRSLAVTYSHCIGASQRSSPSACRRSVRDSLPVSSHDTPQSSRDEPESRAWCPSAFSRSTVVLSPPTRKPYATDEDMNGHAAHKYMKPPFDELSSTESDGTGETWSTPLYGVLYSVRRPNW